MRPLAPFPSHTRRIHEGNNSMQRLYVSCNDLSVLASQWQTPCGRDHDPAIFRDNMGTPRGRILWNQHLLPQHRGHVSSHSPFSIIWAVPTQHSLEKPYRVGTILPHHGRKQQQSKWYVASQNRENEIETAKPTNTNWHPLQNHRMSGTVGWDA